MIVLHLEGLGTFILNACGATNEDKAASLKRLISDDKILPSIAKSVAQEKFGARQEAKIQML